MIVKITILALFALAFLALIISAWVDGMSKDRGDDDYCYGCYQGFCTETPKSDRCKKWRDEHERKT